MILRPRWNKVLADLWNNKARTLLVVLSIAVGVFAVGMVVNAYNLLYQGVNDNYDLTNPSSAFIISTPFTEDLVEVVRNMTQVRDAEGRRVEDMRIFVNDEWFSTTIYGIDYRNARVNLVESTSGAYPPEDRELLVGESVFALTHVEIGDMVIVETPAGDRFQLPVKGFVRDMNSNPSINSNKINIYTTFNTFEWLGRSKDYNYMLVISKESSRDAHHVQKVAGEVKDKMEGSGCNILSTIVFPEPSVSPINFLLKSIRIVLGTLAIVSLMLSTFLVYNTISALVAGQLYQIGIMKSVGAGWRTLVGMYLMLVGSFGFLAFLVAAPPAAWASYAFAQFLSSPRLMDVKLNTFNVSGVVLLLELLVSLLVPLGAAFPAVLRGTRITVREAVNSYGVGREHFGRNRLDHWVKQLHIFTGKWMLAASNMLRQKLRVGLMLGTLVLGGAVFIGVLSVRDSSNRTVEELGKAYQFDIEIIFDRPYRIEKVGQYALEVPGVVDMEGWTVANGTIVYPDGSEGNSMAILAPPSGSRLTYPKIVSGRWLLPQDEAALVIGTDLLRQDPSLQVGGTIPVKIKGREYLWTIVGVYQVMGISMRYQGYANYSYVAPLINELGLARRVQLKTDQHSSDYQSQISVAVDEHLRAEGFRVSTIQTSSSLRSVHVRQFDVVVQVLLMMALLIMLVGGLGLTGTMSMNVIERTREIGIMRAIGATDRSVLAVVIGEGVLTALVSWCLAVICAIPVGKLLSETIGQQIVNGPLSYVYSLDGALAWLALVVVIAVLASAWPAWNASRLTVRDVLAYE